MGITDSIARPQVVYLKDELMARGIVHHDALDVDLVANGTAVNAFRGAVYGTSIALASGPNGTLLDTQTGSTWDARGKPQSGSLEGSLEPVTLSDEYWFSWKRFHRDSELVRL